MSGNASYDFAVPYFTNGLSTFDHILSKAENYAKEKGIDVETFFDARLIEDQLPLSFQVQNTTILAQINLGRLIGEVIKPFEKTEKTFADLRHRIQKTLELLKSTDAAKAAGKEELPVDLAALGSTYQLPAKIAVLNHGLPNFFFHLNAAYAILRSKGVPIGKADYLTSFLEFKKNPSA